MLHRIFRSIPVNGDFYKRTTVMFRNISATSESQRQPSPISREHISASLAPNKVSDFHQSESPSRDISNRNNHYRFANPLDVAAIQECNLKNLPENYTAEFFERHVAMWSELSIVGVQGNTCTQPSAQCPAEPIRQFPVLRETSFMGYALGKLEMPYPINSTRSMAPLLAATPVSAPAASFVGHVTSVAVHTEFRGNGVAKQLMRVLHAQFRDIYRVDTAVLHVRVSNIAAINLYEKSFGYQVSCRIPNYYADGEDAFLMRVDGLCGTL
jgi:ribosomal protein S18 acetylase RimI-like enzyme